MEVKELKIIIKLISKPNYCAKFSEITIVKSSADRNKACRSLHANNYIDITEKIKKIRITEEGKIVLKLDSKDLPITAEESKAIKAFSKKDIITPGKINIKPDKRDRVIDSLIDKGFIEAVDIKIEKCWLTEKGANLLATESSLSGGGNATFSKKMFNDYISFLRNYYANSSQPQIIKNGQTKITSKPTDEEILKSIIDLDTKLNTDNYLPIFHLRNCLQPPLSREELDNALYRLQNDDKIELSKLADGTHYSKEQIDAGIPQPVGGSWFFIIVNE